MENFNPDQLKKKSNRAILEDLHKRTDYMSDRNSKEESFINRKRPALESIVEDLLGPSTQVDEIISGNPLPPELALNRDKALNDEEKTKQ